MPNLYAASCTDWKTVYGKYMKQETWPKTAGWTPASLRQFWNGHGCVRCWFETQTKFEEHLPTYEHDDETVFVANVENSTEWLRERVDNWNDPSTRARGFYCCGKHLKRLKCAAAIVLPPVTTPLHAGHMAWAYEVPPEWQDYWPASMGAWRAGEHALWGRHEENVDNPITAWTDIFDECKVLQAPAANFEEAYLRSIEILSGLYLLVYDNCQSSVDYILKGFGAQGLPDQYYPFEATYFHWIGGESWPLNKRTPGPQPAPPPVPPRQPRLPRKTGGKAATAALRQTMQASRRRQKENAAVAAANTQDGEQVAARLMARSRDAPPAPAAGRRALQSSDDGAVREVYQVPGKAHVHVRRDCPALKSAVAPAKTRRISATHDLDAVADACQAPVCGTCARMIDAQKRGPSFAGDNASIETFRDRIQFTFAGGLLSDARQFDVPWEDIRSVEFSEPTLPFQNFRVRLTIRPHGAWFPDVVDVTFSDSRDGLRCKEALEKELDRRARAG